LTNDEKCGIVNLDLHSCNKMTDTTKFEIADFDVYVDPEGATFSLIACIPPNTTFRETQYLLEQHIPKEIEVVCTNDIDTFETRTREKCFDFTIRPLEIKETLGATLDPLLQLIRTQVVYGEAGLKHVYVIKKDQKGIVSLLNFEFKIDDESTRYMLDFFDNALKDDQSEIMIATIHRYAYQMLACDDARKSIKDFFEVVLKTVMV
jgi:hypothetical protein